MRQTNPIPWKLVGQTIRDANGDVVVSAINPCDMETRKMIVAAVNAWMECNPTNNKLREVLKWAKEKAVYIARHYRTPLSLTGNVAELLAYLNAALAASRATAENSSVVGDRVTMREALEYLRDASREFCHLILNSKYNEVFDKYKYAEVAKIRDAIANANAALAASRATAENSSAVGDNAKMREALQQAKVAILAARKKMGVDNPIILEIIDAALAAPPRNCDVGTADEQERRYVMFTGEHWALGKTALQWAQMPL